MFQPLLIGLGLTVATIFSGIDIGNMPYEAIWREQAGVVEQVDSQRRKPSEKLANSVSNAASGISHSISHAIKSLNESGATESMSKAASSIGHSLTKAIENLPQPKETQSKSQEDELLIQKATQYCSSRRKANSKASIG